MDELNFNSILELENFLKEKETKYFIKIKDVDTIENLNKKIKNKNYNKNFKFIIEDNNYITFVFIEKKFKTYEGLIAKLSIKLMNN